jgi:Tfp pilus assembly protein PilF
MSGSNGDAQKSGARTADDSPSLYEGKPDVVFATEFPVASAEDAVARGEHAYREGDVDLALYMFVRAYDLEKDNVHALTRIGEIHESRGNTRLATGAYRAALRADESNARVLQELGLIYLHAKQLDEANMLLERAVAANPSSWRAHNGLAIIADLRGDHEKAIQSYNAALAVMPNDASLLNNRGYSLYLAGSYPEAANDFMASAKQGEEKAWLNLGLVRARQQKYSEAVRVMSRSVDIEDAYNDVGYIAMRQGDYDVAENFFKKAIEQSPRYFEAAQRNLSELQDRRIGDTKAEPVAMIELRVNE